MSGYKRGDFLRGPGHKPVVLDVYGDKTIHVITCDGKRLTYDREGVSKDSKERLEPMNGAWENYFHEESDFVGIEDLMDEYKLRNA